MRPNQSMPRNVPADFPGFVSVFLIDPFEVRFSVCESTVDLSVIACLGEDGISSTTATWDLLLEFRERGTVAILGTQGCIPDACFR